jgi:small-conductance mechanosensitive channel
VRTSLYFLASFSAIQLLDLWALRPLVERTGTPGLFHTIIKVLVYAAVSFTILRTQYGFDIVPLLTTSAVLSFVLGLALQDTLGNFFAGLTINIEKPYKVGDWVKIGETEGQVVNMS